MTTISVAGAEIDTRHYIGGQRVSSAETFTNTSPIDGTFLGEISRGGQAEADAAVAAARAAFPAWASSQARRLDRREQRDSLPARDHGQRFAAAFTPPRCDASRGDEHSFLR